MLRISKGIGKGVVWGCYGKVTPANTVSSPRFPIAILLFVICYFVNCYLSFVIGFLLCVICHLLIVI